MLLLKEQLVGKPYRENECWNAAVTIQYMSVYSISAHMPQATVHCLILSVLSQLYASCVDVSVSLCLFNLYVCL